MGSGKTTIAKLLAKLVDKKCYDLDSFIERKENKSIAEIFNSKGEVYFRKTETEMLKELLVENPDIILSLGGGTPCFGENIKLIKEKVSDLFYLKSSVENLTERLFYEKESRPLISHLETKELLEEFVRKHLFERSFYYLQANHIIKADGKTAEEISAEIIGLL